MKTHHTVSIVLALAVLAGALSGCRSTKSRTAQPAPVATYSAPTYAPSTTTAQFTTLQPPAPPPMAAPVWVGSPDAPVPAPVPQGFPAVQPAAPGTGIASVIAGEREARARIDEQLAVLEDRIQKAEQGPVSPPAALAATPAASRLTGMSRAEHFAEAIRSKTSGEVEQKGSVVIIRLSDVFQPGSEALRTSAGLTTTLLTVGQELARSPGIAIEVVGHSDATPIKVTKNRWKDNVHLSRARAQTVATSLARHGVAAGRMAVDGRGSVEPVVFPEKTQKDQARNRRVEIVVRF